LKILYVLGGLPFGGIENLMFDISVELKKRGIDHKIVNLSGEGEKVREFLESGLPVINLGRSKKDIKTYKLKTALKLRKLIQEYRPDIVHTMQFSGDYFGRIASIGLPVKVVTHIHNIKKEKRFERRIFNRILSFRTDTFISVSVAVKNYVNKYHNISKRENIILYNGVNFEKLKPYRKSKINGKDRFKLIFVGRLFPQKNIDILIKALAILRKKWHQSHLWIVGEGKERTNLEKLTSELNLKDSIKFLGYQKNVGKFLTKAGIFLLPSSYEGFGIAHLEAMYIGLPAIISPNVPSKEIASECSIISPIEPQKIAMAIEKLFKNENFYIEMAKKAQRIAEKYSIESYVDKLLLLYEKLLMEKTL